jgi:hypothetical protein
MIKNQEESLVSSVESESESMEKSIQQDDDHVTASMLDAIAESQSILSRVENELGMLVSNSKSEGSAVDKACRFPLAHLFNSRCRDSPATADAEQFLSELA